MQDSDITSGFTPGAAIYGSYVLSDTGQGHNNYAATVARFPTAIHLSICTRFNASAQCLDFEEATTGTSAADAQQCVQWVQRMRAQGGIPTVYVQLSLWSWLAGVFDAAGVIQPCWWIAHWTGVAHLEPGSDATQWQGGSLVDLNTAADYWPTVDSDTPSGGGTPIGDGMAGWSDQDSANLAKLAANSDIATHILQVFAGQLTPNSNESSLYSQNKSIADNELVPVLNQIRDAVKAIPGGGSSSTPVSLNLSLTGTATPEAS